MITPEEKAEELVEFFMNVEPPKMSDYSKIYRPTAVLFAKKVCDEVLSDMGADRGYMYWSNVKQHLDK